MALRNRNFRAGVGMVLAGLAALEIGLLMELRSALAIWRSSYQPSS